MPNQALQDCRIAVIGKTDATPQQIKGWIENCSGRVTQGVDDQTTHVIVSEKVWKAGTNAIEDIKQRRKKGQEIHIVKFQWLEECCSKKRRLGEKKRDFSWERDERDSRLETGKNYRENKEPRSGAGLIASTFLDSTDQFVNVPEFERIQKQRALDEEAKKKVELARYQEFMGKEAAKRRMEVAAVFKKGAQRARNELLTDNHHIYTDATGFTYDISVTKIDTRKNRNERYIITIYESNGDNPTYAVNCQFGKTGCQPENNIIAVLGSNFLTAFRSFKKVFKEKTRVDWDDRISVAVERNKSDHLARGQGTDSPTGSRIGVPVEETRTQSQEVPFEDQPFLYHPPKYGPRGELPGAHLGPTKIVPETGELVFNQYLMSGGNGNIPLEMTGGSGEAPDDGHGGNAQNPYRLSSAEFERNVAKLEREEEEMGDVYDEPFSFGRDTTSAAQSQPDEEMEAGQYDGGVVDETQDLLDQFDSDRDNDNTGSLLGKRKLSADDTSEDGSLEKKARAYTFGTVEEDQDQYSSGEKFNHNEPTGEVEMPRQQQEFPSFEELIET